MPSDRSGGNWAPADKQSPKLRIDNKHPGPFAAMLLPKPTPQLHSGKLRKYHTLSNIIRQSCIFSLLLQCLPKSFVYLNQNLPVCVQHEKPATASPARPLPARPTKAFQLRVEFTAANGAAACSVRAARGWEGAQSMEARTASTGCRRGSWQGQGEITPFIHPGWKPDVLRERRERSWHKQDVSAY